MPSHSISISIYVWPHFRGFVWTLTFKLRWNRQKIKKMTNSYWFGLESNVEQSQQIFSPKSGDFEATGKTYGWLPIILAIGQRQFWATARTLPISTSCHVNVHQGAVNVLHPFDELGWGFELGRLQLWVGGGIGPQTNVHQLGENLSQNVGRSHVVGQADGINGPIQSAKILWNWEG